MVQVRNAVNYASDKSLSQASRMVCAGTPTGRGENSTRITPLPAPSGEMSDYLARCVFG